MTMQLPNTFDYPWSLDSQSLIFGALQLINQAARWLAPAGGWNTFSDGGIIQIPLLAPGVFETWGIRHSSPMAGGDVTYQLEINAVAQATIVLGTAATLGVALISVPYVAGDAVSVRADGSALPGNATVRAVAALRMRE